MSNHNAVPLKHLCMFLSGGTPSRKVARYFQGNIPWITSTDVNSRVVTKARDYITEEAVKSSATNIVPRGNILLVTRTGVGKTAIAGIDLCISQDFTGIVPDNAKVDTLYLYHFLAANQDYFVANQRGATIQGVTRDIVANLPIPLPSLDEQRRIADILSRADRLRRLRRTALALSGGYLQSVFLEMFGDPVANPMEWEIKKTGSQIDSIRYGTGSPPTYQSDGIPFIRATNIKDGGVQKNGLVYISDVDARNIEKCRVSAGDLILVRSGVNTGDCALIPQEYDGAYAAYDLIIEAKFPTNYFLNFIINSEYGKAIIQPISRRSGQPHLNAGQAKSLEFPFPPSSLQQKFAGIVRQVERLRGQQREAARQAEGLFQALLQKVFQ